MPFYDPFERFEKHVLPNGLTVYAAHLPERPVQAFQFVIHSGHYHGPHGLAHFTEHVILAAGNLRKYHEELKSIGGYLKNGLATTSPLDTFFGGTLPGNEIHCANFLSRMGKALLESTLEYDPSVEHPPFLSELKQWPPTPTAEKLEEIYRLNSRPDHYWQGLLTAFGTPEEINQRDPEVVKSYYRQHFTPVNCTLITAGPLTVKSILEQINDSAWSTMAPGQRATLPPVYKPKTPVVRKCAFTSPDIAGAEFSSTSIFSPDTSFSAMTMVGRILRKIITDLLREQAGGAYGAKITATNHFGNLHDLDMEIKGLNPETASCWQQTYLKTHELLGTSRLDEEISLDKQGTSLQIQLEEFKTPDIIEVARFRLKTYGKVISQKQLSQNIEDINPQTVRDILSQLHPNAAEQVWTLPINMPCPAGISLYNIDETLAALRKSEIPSPKDPGPSL